MAETRDKTKIRGYYISNDEIMFTNYLNKVIKKIKIRKVLERWKEEIKEMAESTVY